MALIYGDSSWGRATGSGRWDWFLGAHQGGATLAGWGRWDWVMGASHGSTQLDWSDGMDLWGRAMGAHNTDWIQAMGLIYVGAQWGHAKLAGSGQWDWFMGSPGPTLVRRMDDGRKGHGGDTVNDGTSVGSGQGNEIECVVDRECHWQGPEGPGRDEGGEGGRRESGHRVVGGRDDGLEPKGGKVGPGGGV